MTGRSRTRKGTWRSEVCLASALLAISLIGCRSQRSQAPAPALPKEPLVQTKFQAPDAESPLRSFDEIIKLPDERFDVAEAVLALSIESNGVTPKSATEILRRLDDLALRAKEDLPKNPDGIDYFDTLYEVVLDRRAAEPLKEDHADNYDFELAVNKHRGSCLSVGIMTLAVARRMNAPIYGVQCPAHFFLKFVPPPGAKGETVNLDVTKPTPDNWKKLDDNFYRRWHRIDARAESAGAYLRPLSDREVVSAYLSSRAGYFSLKKNYDAALKDASRATALNPRNVTACVNAGYASESLGKLEQAQQHYNAALQIDPRSVRAMNNLAWLKVKDPQSPVYDLKGAERLIETALREQPAKAFLHATAGEVKAAKKDWRGATASLQAALKIEPRNTSYRDRFMYFRERLRNGG